VKTAQFLKKIYGWNGDTRFYQLSSPAIYSYGHPEKRTSYVIVSAIVAIYNGPETYIFPAKANGMVITYREMDGSFRGELDHAQALAGLGYVVAGTGVCGWLRYWLNRLASE